MNLTFFLALTLAQAPDQPEMPVIPYFAWKEAVSCLRDPNRCQNAIGCFREAAREYDYLRRRDGDCVICELWLGYTYQAAGDVPQAIAAYRAGLALNEPGSSVERAKLCSALAYARDQVQYPPSPELARLLQPEREFWPPWLTLQSVGVFAFGLYSMACLAVTRWLMVRRRRWSVVATTLFALTAAPCIGSAIEWQQQRRDAAEPVLVVARDVPLRVGNGPDYPPKLDLPRGCEVRQLFERSGWLQVRSGGGLVGWLPTDAVISPRAS